MSQIPIVTIDALPQPLPAGLHVLDVREPVEWAHGHIEGALHIPLRDLPQRLDEVPTEQTLVVCKVGARSGQAVAWLTQRGLDVINLDGGMLEWVQAGRPMVSDTGSPPQVV